MARRIMSLFWTDRSPSERIALLTLVVTCVALVPAFLALRNGSDDGQSGPSDSNASTATTVPSTPSTPSTPSSAEAGPESSGLVFDPGLRMESPWPDEIAVVVGDDEARLEFNDLATIETGFGEGNTFAWIEIKALDGTYCERFNAIETGLAYLVPMGIGYTMLVTDTSILIVSLRFQAPKEDTTLPTGEPCVVGQ